MCVINHAIQEKIAADSVNYKDVDSVVNADKVVNYPIEVFNLLDLAGLPSHNLSVIVGVPIILFRNGTRLAVKKLMLNVIEETSLNGKSK